MRIDGSSALVTGGASGLGRATADRLAKLGAKVVIVDLPSSNGEHVARELGPDVRFSPSDVTDSQSLNQALDIACSLAPLRTVVHCAGRGGAVRVLDKTGEPGSLELYAEVVRINLIGSFNVLRLSASRMARLEPIEGDRGVVIMTASIAAYEGQIGQAPYASSKAGIVGLTLVAARDLASKAIRVCTIAPGLFDTPILNKVPQDIRDALARAVPHPSRLGHPDEFALTATQIIENPMINGEVIRLDGALRMSPR